MGSSAPDTARQYENDYLKGAYGNGVTSAFDSYKNTLNGTAPSFAETMLKQQTQNNIANQYGMAASQRGRDPAASYRQAMSNTAAINQQAAGQGSMLRAQELEQARTGLIGGYSNFRHGLNEASGVGVGVHNADWDQASKMMTAGGQAMGAGAAMFSDERLKTDIKDGSKDAGKFLDAIKAYSYKYKPGAKDAELGGDGTYVSPMAQDLEKTKLGKSMVKDTPSGKVVDYGKGFGAILAASASLNERLKKIEKKA